MTCGAIEPPALGSLHIESHRHFHAVFGLHIDVVCSLAGSNRSDVGLCTVVPVQEAFQIDHIADLQVANSLISLAAQAAQVGLHTEGVHLAINGYIEVQVVAFLTGVVPLVQEHVLVGIVLHSGSHNSSALEGNLHILIVHQSVGAHVSGHVNGFCDHGVTLDNFQSAVHDLHFAFPSGLLTGHADLCTGNNLLAGLFIAVDFVSKVTALSTLAVDGDLAVTCGAIEPPALGSLDIELNSHFHAILSSQVLSVGHHAFGLARLGRIGLAGLCGSGLGSRSARILSSVAGVRRLASNQRSSHHNDQQQSNDFFHLHNSFFICAYFFARLLYYKK